MNVSQIIRKVQEGLPLSKDEIFYVVENYHKENLPVYQMSALLMAIYFKGLNLDEKRFLTKAMLESGIKVDWPHPEWMVDKHSTGGTGDKTSILLAPLLACMGYQVPMMAGRGLGHTGGTLDKLESLEGYNVNLELESFKKCVLEVGASIIGQTNDLCPADKKLYALRDVTATVSSLPLITASIVSKKVAEGVNSIVYDVKTGSGAFIKEYADSVELAESLVETSKELGLNATALITDMSQPLGRAVGNATEMQECFEIMKNFKESQNLYKDTIDLTLELCAQLVLKKESKPKSETLETAKNLFESGQVFEKALKMFKTQGWTGKDLKLAANYIDYSPFNKSGYIEKIDNELIGWASVELGGGRKKLEDKIDHEVGFYFYKKISDFVEKDEPVLKIYYNDKDKLKSTIKLLDQSFNLSEHKTETPKLIRKAL